MGAAQDTLFEPAFNRSIKVRAFDQKITSHAGAVLLREVDHRLGLAAPPTPNKLANPIHFNPAPTNTGEVHLAGSPV